VSANLIWSYLAHSGCHTSAAMTISSGLSLATPGLPGHRSVVLLHHRLGDAATGADLLTLAPGPGTDGRSLAWSPPTGGILQKVTVASVERRETLPAFGAGCVIDSVLGSVGSWGISGPLRMAASECWTASRGGPERLRSPTARPRSA
jgi:hypothetical protein